MAKDSGKIPQGDDAAQIKPKFIPDYQLLGRDDSGGPDFEPYSAQFGDGEFKQGAKAHLSASGGDVEPLGGDERAQGVRTDGYKRASGNSKMIGMKASASSVADAKD